MKNKILQYVSSAALGVAVFLFWCLLYPYSLGFQEQNQLFLFTWDYFVERIVVGGGLADYIAEFITQFSYLPYLGEILMAVLFVVFQRAIARLIGRDEWYSLSFVAPVMLLLYMGDFSVMLAYLVALIITVQLCIIYQRCPGLLWAGIASVLGYLLIGPAVFVFSLYVVIKEKSWQSLLIPVSAVLAVVVSKLTFLQQYPWQTLFCGINYYRKPLVVPVVQPIIAAVVFAIPVLTLYLPKPKAVGKALVACLVISGAAVGCALSYQKDVAEIVAYDQMVRHEDWKGLVERAEKYQPDSDLGCVSVNLALIMSGRGDELLSFKQFGTTGLIQPRVRDYISNSSSAEVFWRLGMINESLRYAFDTQESMANNRKSGRWMSRVAECQILNGRYDAAEKYLDILSHSLFYRKWAKDHRKYLRNDEEIASDKVYAYLQAVRYKEDFLYYYPEMDKMLAKLYFENRNNVLAAWYFNAWTALKINETYDKEIYSGNAHAN